jgi:hypothetical protein
MGQRQTKVQATAQREWEVRRAIAIRNHNKIYDDWYVS